MGVFRDFQSLVLLVLGVIALGAESFAFIDALRAPERAYVAAGKRTKTFWLVLLGIALAVGVVTVFNVLNLFGLLAFVGAAVYLADVRPALRQVLGRGGGRGW
jgi:predicted CDP-diglyceride synthetase/phosphatidate cytidylyltransferase